jgi:hypothetical protein
MIYTKDHPPAHVHVWKAGNQVLINLGDEQTRVSVRENRGMSAKSIVKAARIAGDYQEYLLEKWRDIHG